MKTSSLVLLSFLLITGILSAQIDFRPGYIITTVGDTLHGEIDYRGDMLMGKVCKFKSAGKKATDYSPDDISAFRFLDSKYFISRAVEDKKVFLEYLIKGEINVYYYRDRKGEHYYIDNKDNKLLELAYEEVIKEIDGKNYVKTSTKHIGMLSYYMQDAPQLKRRIQNFKEPEHRNLIKLAEDYHNAVCDGEKCIIYEKQVPLIKVNIETVAGVVKFINAEEINTDIENRYFPQYGLIAHIWAPRTNEKIYFKTGFLYSDLLKARVSSLPTTKFITHIGYMAPNTYRIRPSLSIGIFSPSYSGGVAVRVNKSINFGFQAWANFNAVKSTLVVPKDLFNYSVLGSIYVEL